MRRLNGRLVRRQVGFSWHTPIPQSQDLPYPLSEARKAARDALLHLARGIDPKARKDAERRAEAIRQANSFASVVETFIVRHVRSLRSAADAEAAIRRELIPKWGDRPITEISRRDVVELVEQIAESGRRYVAFQTFSYASKLFSWAIARHSAQ